MEQNNQYINSIVRAVELLNLYQSGERELGITEIARRMKLHKSSVHRIVRTLEHLGWLEQNPDSEKYKLGLGILDVAGVLLKTYDYREVISASMRELKNAVGETIVLSVYTNHTGVCIDLVEAENRITYTSKLGHPTPVYSGATGKILLAYQDPAEVDYTVAAGLKQFTPGTIVTEEALRADLAEIRKNGYATSFEETDYGVSAIGAPIFSGNGALLYGLSIVGPTERLREKGVEALIKAVADEAANITGRIRNMSV